MPQGENSGGTTRPIIGLILLSISPTGFLALLVWQVGWWSLAFPALGLLALLGWRMVTVPASGSAGAGGNGAGVPYVIQLNPEDPNAGVPRRKA